MTEILHVARFSVDVLTPNTNTLQQHKMGERDVVSMKTKWRHIAYADELVEFMCTQLFV
jgi:hypothetical protein